MNLTNNFSKGLNQDLAISRLQNDTLYDGFNFEISTDTGLTTGIITNTKGNKLFFNFPNLFDAVYFEIDYNNIGTSTFSIRGVTANITITNVYTTRDLYDDLNTIFAALIASGDIIIHYSNSRVFIQGVTAILNYVPTTFVGLIPTYYNIVVPSINLSIIGWGVFDDGVVIHTCLNTQTDADPLGKFPPFTPAPVPYYGQIWYVKFDKTNNQIISTTGTSLNIPEHLKYNGLLNYSLANPIGNEVISRRENSLKGNSYFTDNYNSPRVINLFNSNSLAVPESFLDFNPDCELSPISNIEILNGGSLLSGSYQIAYRYVTLEGGFSKYSAPSYPISVSSSVLNPTAANYEEFQGDLTGTQTNKSIKAIINDIDLRYDIIEFIAINYELKDVPVIAKFAEVPITNSTEEIVFTGNEDLVAITIEEFNLGNVDFLRFKTFTEKKNILYPANVKTPNFDVDYDARAYRFSHDPSGLYASPTCHIYDRKGNFKTIDATDNFRVSEVNGVGVTPFDLPDTDDAVNPYNDETGTVFGLLPGQTYADWKNLYQFICQANGTTLGGEGLNVKYKFITEDFKVEDITYRDDASIPLHLNDLPVASFLRRVLNKQSPLISTSPFNATLKNPVVSQIKKTFSRGEVYRAGIVFINNKGQSSFVKWIGDVKIPEPSLTVLDDQSNNYSLGERLGYTSGVQQLGSDAPSELFLNVIGIEFTLDNLHLLPSDVIAYKIVFVERKEKEKSRFGTGLHLPILPFDMPNQRLEINGLDTDVYALGLYLRDDSINELSNVANEGISNNYYSYVRSEYFSENYNGGVRTDTPNLGVVKSPLVEFDNYYNREATHLKLIEEIGHIEDLILQNGPASSSGSYSPPLDRGSAWFIRPRTFNPVSHPRIISIEDKIQVHQQEFVDTDGVVNRSLAPGVMQYDFHNVCIRNAANEMAGVGGKSLFVVHDKVETEIGDLSPDYRNPGNGTGSGPAPYSESNTANLANPQTDDFRIVSFVRDNLGQYGGPWRSSRYNNVYVSLISPIVKITGSTHSSQCFGDTFMSYYDTVYFGFHWALDYSVPTRGGVGSGLGPTYAITDQMKAVTLAIACESPVNTFLRNGIHASKNQLTTGSTFINTLFSFANVIFDEKNYLDSYSQTNNTNKFISKPFNFRTDEEDRVIIYASKRKFDGELIDSWRDYSVNNFIRLEDLGQINKVINLKDSIIAYQDRAIAFVQSEQPTTVPSQDSVLQAGTGAILSRFDYVSRDTGTIHQHGIVVAPNMALHYDSYLDKIFALSGNSAESLSDMLGVSSLLRRKCAGILRNSDNILLNEGVVATTDEKHNKAIFTFLNKILLDRSVFTVISPTERRYTHNNIEIHNGLDVNDYLTDRTGNIYLIKENTPNSLLVEILTNVSFPNAATTGNEFYLNFTISFNKLFKTFEIRYNFTPRLYLDTHNQLLSANPRTIQNSAFIHKLGNRGEFYGFTYPSYIDFIVNFPYGDKLLTFRSDKIKFWSEVFDANGIFIPFESISKIELFNSYQNTSQITLSPNQNIKVFERTWSFNKLYDVLSNKRIKPYLRDKYVRIRIWFNNNQNKEIKLNDISIFVTPSYPVANNHEQQKD